MNALSPLLRTFIVSTLLILLAACSREDPLFIQGEGLVSTSGKRLVITPVSREINVATTQQYRALLADLEAGTLTDVTDTASWSSSDTSTASVDAQGLASGIAAGSSSIKATVEGLTASANLTVSDLAVVELIVAPPEQATLVGVSRQFTATARFADNRTQEVTTDVAWSSDNTTVSTVDGSGLATALSQGTAAITASLSGVNGTGTLAVLNAAPTGMQIDPPEADLVTGQSLLLAAWLLLDNGDRIEVTREATWASTDGTVFAVSNNDGSKGSGSAIDAGQASAIATLQFAGNSFTDQASITVTAPALTQLLVTPAQTSVPAGTQGLFTATAYYSDNTSANVTNAATWLSTDTAIADVIPDGSQAGLASALSPGVTTIEARFGGLSASAALTVTNATLESLQVTPAEDTLPAGLTTPFYATAQYSDGTSTDVTTQSSWFSSDSAIATLTSDGTAYGNAAGTVTVTATFNSMQASAQLTVTTPNLVALQVTPDIAEIPVETTTRFIATGIYSDNTTRDLSKVATWGGSAPDIARTGITGLAFGITPGSETVTASFQGFSDDATLTVLPGTLQNLVVFPRQRTRIAGSTQQYEAIGFFTDHIADLTDQVSWTSSNNTVATIGSSGIEYGLANALSEGTVTLTANFQGTLATGLLTVEPAVVEQLEVVCTHNTVPAGERLPCNALATYSDGAIQSVRADSDWSTSDTVIGVVNNPGTGIAGLFTGVAPGIVDVSARFAGNTASTSVTVTNATLSSLVVNVFNTTIQVDDQEQFYAEATFSDGSSLDVTDSALWTSGDPGLLSISNASDSKGLGRAQAVGTLTVSADHQGINALSPLITITDMVPPDASDIGKIQILCDNATSRGPVEINVGDIDRCKAWARLKSGGVEDVTDQATWSIDTPTVATGLGLSGDNYYEYQGALRGDTILRAEFGKRAVINIKVY